ncbi:MAG: PAS domain-containing protein [Raineya sp.]|jgi:PAS domain S-box-containing protein|nr:PAS domain-containing protein [Raineya sp.]
MAKSGLFSFLTHPSFAIRRRIFWGLSTIGFLLLVVVLGFIVRIEQLSQREQYLLQIAYPSQQQLEALKSYLTQTNSALQNQLIYRNPLFASDRENIWRNYIKSSTDSLNTYEKKWLILEDRTEYAALLTEIQKLRRYQRSIANNVEVQENNSNTTTGIKKDTTEDVVVILEEQEKAVFDLTSAFPTTDLEATIEGLETVQGKGSDIQKDFGDKIDVDETIISENAKQQFQKQVIELTNKIYIDIDRLIRNRKDQIKLEKSDLSFQWRLLQQLSIVAIVVMILLIYVIAQNIGKKFMLRLTKLEHYLDDLGKGETPNITQDREKDEITSSIRKTEKISSELQNVAKIAHLVSAGNLYNHISIFENQGVLGKAFNNMQISLQTVAEQDEIRNWQNEGLSLFAEILRDIENPQKLYDALARNIVKYVKANYGGIYIANTDGDVVPHLELKSCYAYDKKKYIQQQIYLGQGLVGQCWQEGLSIYLLKVPHDYLNIASGLGEERPSSVLIVPIKVGSDVYGVIEVASLKKFTDNEKVFLETIAEDIASTISSIKSNEKTRLLLAESRNLTQLMTSQEEQMKQSMAQLVATQEELEKKNSDMTALVEAINKASIVVELDRHGYFLRVNERFLEVSGYQYADVVGQHRSFYAPKDSDPAEFNLLWAQLAQGVYVEKNIRRLRKNGTEFWMRASFFPVMDEQGILYKVTSICTDITDKMLKENKELEAQKTVGFKNAALEHSFLVFETNEKFKIKNINSYAVQDLQIHKEDYLGHHIDDLIIGRLDYKQIIAQLETREIDEGIIALKAADFDYRYVSFVLAAVKDKKGELETIFFIGTDITEYKKKEIQLENEVKVLESKIQKLEAQQV